MYIRGKSCHKSQTAVAVAVAEAAETAALDCFHMVMSFRFSGRLRLLQHFVALHKCFATNGVKVFAVIQAELKVSKHRPPTPIFPRPLPLPSRPIQGCPESKLKLSL